MPLTKIQSLGITDGAIVAADIASGAITAAKLAAGVGGKVLQVVGATDTTQRTTTSTSFVTASSTLSINITPSTTSSKIFLIASFYSYQSATATLATFYRDSTNVAASNGLGRFVSNAGAFDGQINLSFLDSPSTTSSINYTVRIKANGSGTSYLGDNTETATFTAFEIGA